MRGSMAESARGQIYGMASWFFCCLRVASRPELLRSIGRSICRKGCTMIRSPIMPVTPAFLLKPQLAAEMIQRALGLAAVCWVASSIASTGSARSRCNAAKPVKATHWRQFQFGWTSWSKPQRVFGISLEEIANTVASIDWRRRSWPVPEPRPNHWTTA